MLTWRQCRVKRRRLAVTSLLTKNGAPLLLFGPPLAHRIHFSDLLFCCVGVERITSIEFYPRSHPDLRVPHHGERILPNTHSKQKNVVLPLSKRLCRVQVLFCLKRSTVKLSRDFEKCARDDKRVRPCSPRSGFNPGVLQRQWILGIAALHLHCMLS